VSNIFHLSLNQYIISFLLNFQAFFPTNDILLIFIEKQIKKIEISNCPLTAQKEIKYFQYVMVYIKC